MPELSAILSLGRYVLLAYAAAATLLTTSCLALHVLTAFARRGRRRPAQSATTVRRLRRPLFLRLGAEHE